MEKFRNENKPSDAEISSSQLLLLNDESIQRIVTENWQVDDLLSLVKIGEKLRDRAEAMLEEKFRDYYVTINGMYVDFGIKLENLKKFASYIRNIRIKEIGEHNNKKTATFVETNFPNLKRIELKFSVITHRLGNIFKNVDTIIFNACEQLKSETNFCFYDDCLKYCKSLRCLYICSYGTSKDDEDRFIAVMAQTYPGLEKVHLYVRYTPKMLKHWERFIQLNGSIKSLSLRFLNENEKFVMKVLKPVVDHALNLQQLFLYLDMDARYTYDAFNFEIIHEQLTTLDRREHYEYLGLKLNDSTNSKIKKMDLCASLKSLRLLHIGHNDPCNILPEISKYSNNVETLALYTCFNTCRLGDHQMLDKTWTVNFVKLEVLHFRKVANAYLLIPHFIRRSPNLKKIVARDCKIVFEKNQNMSMKKFNDERSKVCISGEELIIYSNQPNIQSNYEFNLVKLKHIEFENIEFNECNPFECYIEDKIGLSVFNSTEDHVRFMRNVDDGTLDSFMNYLFSK